MADGVGCGGHVEEVEVAGGCSAWTPQAGCILQYPTSVERPVRDYQVQMVRHAVASDAVLTLPTGFGKGVPSAVLAENFLRWSPTGRVVVVVSNSAMGFLQRAEFELAVKGKTFAKPSCTVLGPGTQMAKRQKDWGTARVVFCTPDVVESDAPHIPSAPLLVLVDASLTGRPPHVAQAIRLLRKHTRAPARFVVLAPSTADHTLLRDAIGRRAAVLAFPPIADFRLAAEAVAGTIHEVAWDGPLKNMAGSVEKPVAKLIDDMHKVGFVRRVQTPHDPHFTLKYMFDEITRPADLPHKTAEAARKRLKQLLQLRQLLMSLVCSSYQAFLQKDIMLNRGMHVEAKLRHGYQGPQRNVINSEWIAVAKTHCRQLLDQGGEHPKVKALVALVTSLWAKGVRKYLVFCSITEGIAVLKAALSQPPLSLLCAPLDLATPKKQQVASVQEWRNGGCASLITSANKLLDSVPFLATCGSFSPGSCAVVSFDIPQAQDNDLRLVRRVGRLLGAELHWMAMTGQEVQWLRQSLCFAEGLGGDPALPQPPEGLEVTVQVVHPASPKKPPQHPAALPSLSDRQARVMALCCQSTGSWRERHDARVEDETWRTELRRNVITDRCFTATALLPAGDLPDSWKCEVSRITPSERLGGNRNAPPDDYDPSLLTQLRSIAASAEHEPTLLSQMRSLKTQKGDDGLDDEERMAPPTRKGPEEPCEEEPTLLSQLRALRRERKKGGKKRKKEEGQGSKAGEGKEASPPLVTRDDAPCNVLPDGVHDGVAFLGGVPLAFEEDMKAKKKPPRARAPQCPAAPPEPCVVVDGVDDDDWLDLDVNSVHPLNTEAARHLRPVPPLPPRPSPSHWTCKLCSATNEEGRGNCAVCGEGRGVEAESDESKAPGGRERARSPEEETHGEGEAQHEAEEVQEVPCEAEEVQEVPCEAEEVLCREGKVQGAETQGLDSQYISLERTATDIGALSDGDEEPVEDTREANDAKGGAWGVMPPPQPKASSPAGLVVEDHSGRTPEETDCPQPCPAALSPFTQMSSSARKSAGVGAPSQLDPPTPLGSCASYQVFSLRKADGCCFGVTRDLPMHQLPPPAKSDPNSNILQLMMTQTPCTGVPSATPKAVPTAVVGEETAAGGVVQPLENSVGKEGATEECVEEECMEQEEDAEEADSESTQVYPTAVQNEKEDCPSQSSENKVVVLSLEGKAVPPIEAEVGAGRRTSGTPPAQPPACDSLGHSLKRAVSGPGENTGGWYYGCDSCDVEGSPGAVFYVCRRGDCEFGLCSRCHRRNKGKGSDTDESSAEVRPLRKRARRHVVDASQMNERTPEDHRRSRRRRATGVKEKRPQRSRFLDDEAEVDPQEKTRRKKKRKGSSSVDSTDSSDDGSSLSNFVNDATSSESSGSRRAFGIKVLDMASQLPTDETGAILLPTDGTKGATGTGQHTIVLRNARKKRSSRITVDIEKYLCDSEETSVALSDIEEAEEEEEKEESPEDDDNAPPMRMCYVRKQQAVQYTNSRNNECFRCGEVGHWASACPTRHPTAKGGTSSAPFPTPTAGWSRPMVSAPPPTPSHPSAPPNAPPPPPPIPVLNRLPFPPSAAPADVPPPPPARSKFSLMDARPPPGMHAGTRPAPSGYQPLQPPYSSTMQNAGWHSTPPPAPSPAPWRLAPRRTGS